MYRVKFMSYEQIAATLLRHGLKVSSGRQRLLSPEFHESGNPPRAAPPRSGGPAGSDAGGSGHATQAGRHSATG